MAFAKTFPLVILIIFLGPSYAIWNANEIESAQWVYDIAWNWLPVYLTILLRVLGLVVKDTTRLDRIYKPTADLPYLRVIYGISIIICGSLYLSGGLGHLISIPSLIQRFQSPSQLAQAVLDGNSGLLEIAGIFSYGATFYWALLNFADLKFVGKLSRSWLLILAALFLSTVVAGPGAALLIMCAWREEIMAKKNEIFE